MKRPLALAALLLLPFSAYAGAPLAGQSLAEPAGGNSYLAGGEVSVDVPLPADLLAAAGTLIIAAPVAGDGLALAGSASVLAPVEGDLRLAGGSIRVESEVGGELAAAGGRILITKKAGSIRAAGGTIEIRDGADGPVTLYGANVLLAGEFAGDVRVVASDHVTLAEGTVIRGAFEYNAPQEAGIPASANIEGGARYIGSSSFLPTTEEAETFAIAGLGIFFVVRVVAAMLAAGLVAGLFPAFAARIADETLGRSARRAVLLTLLGFAIMVATPVATILLLASFVGIGLAALLGALYLFVLMLAYVYAAVIAGAALMRVLFKRRDVPWKGAMLGMLAFYLIGLVPFAGFAVAFVLTALALGAMTKVFYTFAFSRERDSR